MKHAGVYTRPAWVGFVGNAAEIPVFEEGLDGTAGRCVARDLNEHLLAQAQAVAGGQFLPVQAAEGDVLTQRAGEEWVSLGLQGQNPLQGVQAQGALRASVVFQVLLVVAIDSIDVDLCLRNG